MDDKHEHEPHPPEREPRARSEGIVAGCPAGAVVHLEVSQDGETYERVADWPAGA